MIRSKTFLETSNYYIYETGYYINLKHRSPNSSKLKNPNNDSHETLHFIISSAISHFSDYRDIVLRQNIPTLHPWLRWFNPIRIPVIKEIIGLLAILRGWLYNPFLLAKISSETIFNSIIENEYGISAEPLTARHSFATGLSIFGLLPGFALGLLFHNNSYNMLRAKSSRLTLIQSIIPLKIVTYLLGSLVDHLVSTYTVLTRCSFRPIVKYHDPSNSRQNHQLGLAQPKEDPPSIGQEALGRSQTYTPKLDSEDSKDQLTTYPMEPMEPMEPMKPVDIENLSAPNSVSTSIRCL